MQLVGVGEAFWGKSRNIRCSGNIHLRSDKIYWFLFSEISQQHALMLFPQLESDTDHKEIVLSFKNL